MKLKREMIIKLMAGLLSVIVLFSLIFVSYPVRTRAASAGFYLSPSSGSVNVGETLTASVMVSTDVAINAGEGSVIFSSDTLEFQSVSGSGSIFSFWTSGPSGSAASVVFGGGLPNPGYEGGGGNVVTIVWKAKTVGTGTVSIIGNKILANDGVGTNILTSSGGGSFSINPPGTPTQGKTEKAKLVMTITSTSHPDQGKWFSNKNVVLNWSANEAKSYLVAFDQSESGAPAEQTTATSKTYQNNADGIWYFHAQAKGDSGIGPAAHFKAQVDVTPPEPFSVSINQDFGAFDPSPKVIFEAKDLTSGIERYEAVIGDKPPIEIKSGDNLPKQFPGKHILVIRAYDKAGNVRESKTDLIVGGVFASTIKIFGFEIPIIYLVYLLLIILIILLILDFYLWKKMRRLVRNGATVFGLAFGRVKKMFSKTENDIDQEIERTIPVADLSKGVVKEMKKDLKEKVHSKIEEEKSEIDSANAQSSKSSLGSDSESKLDEKR